MITLSILGWFLCTALIQSVGWGQSQLQKPFEPPAAWMSDWDSALAEAKKSSRPILGAFGELNCGVCVYVLEKLQADPTLQKEEKNWVVFYHVDGSPEIKAKFRIESNPTVILFSSDGREEDRMLGMISEETLAKTLINHKDYMNRLRKAEQKVQTQPSGAAYQELGDLYTEHTVFYPPSQPSPDRPLAAYRKAVELDPSLRESLSDRLYFYEALQIHDEKRETMESLKQKLERFEGRFPKSSLLVQIPFYKLITSMALDEAIDAPALIQKACERFRGNEFTAQYRMILSLMGRGGS